MQYTRAGPDGLITTDEGFDIFDHVEQTVSKALAYPTVIVTCYTYNPLANSNRS